MKKIFSLVLVLVLSLGISSSVFAAEEDVPFEVTAVMINNETGEKIPVEVECVKDLQINTFLTVGNKNQNVTANAIFKIPTGIQPLYVDTSTTTTDVTASISINYDRQNDKIRVNQVYGSWKPEVSLIEISERQVDYGDGAWIGGHSAHQYPTSNTFSYTTGWSWVDWYPNLPDAATGARAFSSATVSVTGMSGSHTIEVFVTANQ